MLILYRKSGEGIEIKNKISGDLFDFDFLYNRSGKTTYRINGELRTIDEREPFYVDDNSEVMTIVIQAEQSIRIGIDAPEHFQIRRKEVPFD